MRLPVVFRGCRNDERCNLRPLHLSDFTRLVVCPDPLSANRFNVFRLVAIKYAIRFKYLDRDFSVARLRFHESIT